MLSTALIFNGRQKQWSGKVVVVGKKGGGVQGATLLSKTMKDTIKQSIIMIYEATGKSIIQEKQGQSRSEYNFN